ncbi:ATP-binding protein [Humibacillus xanthopallidus]|uniref:ATP-binding protein n=1 Tax=Humibacillus xanthopallidus TaxID=412689 RepID=UPI001150DE42|nr:LuxR family transcriptional regulator [Humibacillus xanthopallidus]
MEVVERDPQIAQLRRAMRSVVRRGRVIAVTGEPGAGKTTLLRAVTSASESTRVARGLCDPLATPRPLGPVRDVLAELGAALPDDGSTAPAEVGARLAIALADQATTVVIEDAQWIDEASVDVLRFLARRVETLPTLLLLSYRADEIGPGHTLRPLLGDLARLEHATTITLSPLSIEAVGTLLRDTSLDPQRVHRITAGNAFYVTEIARHPDEELPSSVRDAVLASTSSVEDADLEVLQIIATSPDAVDDRLLPLLGIDLPQLRRIESTGLLNRSRRGLAYRHELARLAVADAIPLGGAPALHARMLAALEQFGSTDVALLTHHARAAHDRGRTSRYAVLAGTEAARAGSHTEAVAFLALALSHLDEDRSEQARVLQLLSNEQYMVSRLPDAVSSISTAIRLWDEIGDADGVAAAHDRGAVIEYYSARRVAAERHARLAARDPDTAAYASACATQAYLAYRRNDDEAADLNLRAARERAEATGDELVRLRCDIVTAAANLVRGSYDARALLEQHAQTALELSFDELGTTAYSNLSAIDIEQRRYREAEEVLARSIPITVERDIPLCNQWQRGMRARVHLHRGRWAAAEEDARAVLEEGAAPLASMWPHLVLGLIALRRMDGAGAEADDGSRAATVAGHLDAAWELAARLDEPLARLPVLSALVEQAWVNDTHDERLQAISPTLASVSSTPGMGWAMGDLAVWADRIALERGGIDTRNLDLAEPFRLELDGLHGVAAQWWVRAGAPFESAITAAHSADPVTARLGVEELESLGARATAHRCRDLLRSKGFPVAARGRRASTRANPSGLTNRQLDVARLVARGLTNAELAEQLFISPKTADHHVSAVLTKLGLRTRREVARRSVELGLD